MRAERSYFSSRHSIRKVTTKEFRKAGGPKSSPNVLDYLQGAVAEKNDVPAFFSGTKVQSLSNGHGGRRPSGAPGKNFYIAFYKKILGFCNSLLIEPRGGPTCGSFFCVYALNGGGCFDFFQVFQKEFPLIHHFNSKFIPNPLKFLDPPQNSSRSYDSNPTNPKPHKLNSNTKIQCSNKIQLRGSLKISGRLQKLKLWDPIN